MNKYLNNIYIYIEREREMYIHMYTHDACMYMYVSIYIYIHTREQHILFGMKVKPAVIQPMEMDIIASKVYCNLL